MKYLYTDLRKLYTKIHLFFFSPFPKLTKLPRFCNIVNYLALWYSNLHFCLQHKHSSGVPILVLTGLLLIQLHVDVPEKATEDGASVWAHATHMGDSDGVPDSWLHPRSSTVNVAIWGVYM